jgi:hypothetical protein
VTLTSVCQWHNGKCVYVRVSVCVCHSSFSLSSWVQGACLDHITSIKVLSRRLPHKSLFMSPTLLKSLSGDAEVAGTARCCLAIRSRRGNSYTFCFHHMRGSVSRDTCCTLVQVFNSASTLSTSTSIHVRSPKRSLKAPSALDLTNEILCLTVWFLKDVLTSSRGLRLLTHRLPTRMLGLLGLFARCTLSHSPCRSLCLFGLHHNSLSRPAFLHSWKFVFFLVSLFFVGFFSLVF